MGRKLVILFFSIILIINTFGNPVHNLKEYFDFGINIYEYDFSLKNLSFDEYINLIKNNPNIEVQTELIVNYLFYSKDSKKGLLKLEAEIGHRYLSGERFANSPFVFSFIKFLKVYLLDKKYLSDIIDVLREFELMEKLYKSNPWIYLVNSLVMYVESKEKIMEKYELPFYEKVEYAIYNGGDSSKIHYSVGNFFKNVGSKNPSAHKLAVIEYQKAVKLLENDKVLKTVVLKELISLMDMYKLSDVKNPAWLEEIVYMYTIDINPSDAFAYNNLAFLYVKEYRKPEKALEYALKAYSIKNNDADVLDTLAYCYMANGKVEQARKYFEKAYVIDRKNQSLLKHMSDFYLVLDQEELSIKYLKEYVDINVSDVEAFNNLAYLLALSEKELDRALELVNQAIAMSKERKDIYVDTLGWIYFKKKRYKDSLDIFNTIKNVEDIEILMHKAFVQTKLAKYEDALLTFREAIKADPDNNTALNNYVVINNLVKDDDKISFMKDFIWEK